MANVLLGGFSNVATVAAAGLQSLHFSRDDEREADAFAVDFLRSMGLPPQTMADALSVLQRETANESGTLPSFLSTHPATEERIKAARDARDAR